MTDIPTDAGPSQAAEQGEAPGRRLRRRAASRPAGPPVAAPAAADPAAAAADPAAADPTEVLAEEPLPDTLPVEVPVDDAANAPAEPPAAAKRAPRKRAARKTAAPAVVAGTADVAASEATSGDTTDDAIEAPPAKKAARKRASRARRPTDPSDIEPPLASAADPAGDTARDEPVAPEPVAAPATLAVPLLFQAPEPAAAAPRSRRRASAPAGPPSVSDDAVSNDAAVEDDVVEDLVEPLADHDIDDDIQAAIGAGLDTAADLDGPPDSDVGPEDGTGGARKRRRRGGRGRRPRTDDEPPSTDTSSGTAPADTAVDDVDSSTRATSSDSDPVSDVDTGASDISVDEGRAGLDEDDPQGSEDDEPGSASSRRRRRRRRRGSSGTDAAEAEADSAQDPPGTITRVRAPRRIEDEVASVRGSTRLEAKKQRRRDGREAGRRKPAITESEFLARRESVQRSMVVRESNGRTQIAVLEDGVLVEHYVANETNASMIGNVYLGRVQNVLPSMEAAFVDIGKGRNAVLYAGEVNWDAAGMEGQPRRIETALKSGDTVLVQVTKDPMGHKGARLTSQVSLPGRYLVFVPNSTMTGISRKLPDTERSRLKRILKAVVPEKAGVIVRTAAEGASEDELAQDVERLTAQWASIEARAGSSSGGAAPKLLYGEPDLTIRVVRDVFNEDFTSLVVSGEGAWGVVQPYLTNVAPDLADRVTRWTSDKDVFAEHRIDEQLLKAMDRKVWLPSGGSLVIDRTEAMTVVDVNTGKFTGAGGNLEETVTRNNLEAAEEVVRQLRLRDIGGIIVVDFIDMVLEGNRDLVLRRLLECLGRDRTKHQVAEVTSLGLVQMTRKRVGQGLLEVFSEPCEHCQGRGVVIHAEPVERRSGSNGLGTSAGAVGSSLDTGGGKGGGSGTGGGSRRGRGRGAETPAPVLPPVRQPIPAGFVASLAHHDAPTASLADAGDVDVVDPSAGTADPATDSPVADTDSVTAPNPEAPADTASEGTAPADTAPKDTAPLDPPPLDAPPTDVAGAPQIDLLGTDIEPPAEPTRPARRRRRAVAPSGPPTPRG